MTTTAVAFARCAFQTFCTKLHSPRTTSAILLVKSMWLSDSHAWNGVTSACGFGQYVSSAPLCMANDARQVSKRTCDDVVVVDRAFF